MVAMNDTYIAPGVVITGDVEFGLSVNLWYGVIVRADLARITLEARVNIQDGSILHTDFGVPLVVEEGVVVGHRALLHGRRIGRDTLIGMGAILLGGSEIGAECLIAAGTLITENRRIPPRSVVMGVPGKVVREVTEDDLRRTRAINASYIELAERYTHGAFGPAWPRQSTAPRDPA